MGQAENSVQQRRTYTLQRATECRLQPSTDDSRMREVGLELCALTLCPIEGHPKRVQERNRTGWREDDTDHCQCLLIQGGPSAGMSMSWKMLQIPGDATWMKGQSFLITKITAQNPS